MPIDPSEIEALWSLTGKVGAVLAAIVALIKAYQFLVQLTPVAKLEKRVTACEKHDETDFNRINGLEKRVIELEKKTDEVAAKIDRVDEGIQRLGKSQISLFRHMIDGNGVDKMREEEEDLTEFFIKRSRPTSE